MSFLKLWSFSFFVAWNVLSPPHQLAISSIMNNVVLLQSIKINIFLQVAMPMIIVALARVSL
jgi:hypothetical protein